MHRRPTTGVIIGFLVLCVIEGLCGNAMGIPIAVGPLNVDVTIDTDTPTDLQLTFAGGAVTASGASTPANQPVPGLANWAVNFDIFIFDLSPGNPDRVAVLGTVVHTNNMPDDGPHFDAAQFGFGARYAGGPPPGIFLTPPGGGGFARHPTKAGAVHTDVYSLSAELARNAADANDIASWNLELTGTHVPAQVPEPSTLLLLGMGSLALTCAACKTVCRRRRPRANRTTAQP